MKEQRTEPQGTAGNTSFAANLALLRREHGLSQEQLAERLGVSRQSVSKWESSVCLPELATLDVLCTMFGCTLDTLLRGSVEKADCDALAAYDSEWNIFAGAVTFGVAAILLGITLTCLCLFAGLPENVAGFVTLLGIIVGVVTFVASGIRHGDFEKGHPAIEIVYPPEQPAAFARKFPWLMAGGVGLILADTAMIALLAPTFEARLGAARGDALAGTLFMLVLTAAVGILVWGGMQQGKYTDPDEQRRRRDEPAYARRQDRIGRAVAVLWLLTVLVYLLWGFLGDAWQINWVAFVAGGLLTAALSVLLGEEK